MQRILCRARERFDDSVIDKTDRQTGLEIRPLRSLLLRGSTSTSFKPPTLLDTHVPEVTYSADEFGLVDPARGNEPITTGTVGDPIETGLAVEVRLDLLEQRGGGALEDSDGRAGPGGGEEAQARRPRRGGG